jgi:hypothetical protein
VPAPNPPRGADSDLGATTRRPDAHAGAYLTSTERHRIALFTQPGPPLADIGGGVARLPARRRLPARDAPRPRTRDDPGAGLPRGLVDDQDAVQEGGHGEVLGETDTRLA